MGGQAAEQIIAGVVLSERLAVTMYGAIHRAQFEGQRNQRGLVVDPRMLAEASFRIALTDTKAVHAVTELGHPNIVPTVTVEDGGPDVVVVTDDNPRSEDPALIRRELLRGARTLAGKRRLEVADRARAIRMAVALAGEGDVVLVLGKGHEQGQEAAGTVTPFDDRVALAEAMEPGRIVPADLPADKQRMLERLHSSDEMLAGRTVLVVDDDTRNIFALSSALERRSMHVLTATTGREAISILEASPEVAIVLMDIMMPEMDGYETIALIRSNPALRRLPIDALTAKAMKGDREKCLEAGASDYLAKPVNTEQLFSALRLWLHR